MDKKELIYKEKDGKIEQEVSDWDLYKAQFIKGVLKGFDVIEILDKKYSELKHNIEKIKKKG